MLEQDTGYYSVDGVAYSTRFEALDQALKKTKPINYHWHDEYWEKKDWLNPTPVSFEELYKQRAEQIRAKYDYIVLCYSGGADSWNILKTFDKNNIHIDEICTFHDLGLTGTKDSLVTSEVYKVAIPVADEYIRRHPNTLRVIVEGRDVLLEVFRTHSIEQLMSSYYQSPMSLFCAVRGGAWVYQMAHYKKLVQSGKSVCLLWGWEKTYPRIHQGKYAFQFHDNTIQAGHKLHNTPFPVHDEFFYWGTGAGDLLIKQCHHVKNMLESLPTDYVDPHPIKVIPKKVYCMFNKRDTPVSFITLNTWLYGWDPNTFTEGRLGGTSYWTEQDFWVKDYMNEAFAAKWKKMLRYGITNYYSKIQEAHKNPANSTFGITPLLKSRHYFLET